jgi:hypothetical protein
VGRKHACVDVVGVLCALGLAGPVFALIEQPQRGWSDPLIIGGLVAGVVLLSAFVWWEQRTPQPMLPLRLFRKRNFTFANIETLTVYAGLSTLTFFLVIFLQQLAGYSALKSGFALVPITVVMFVPRRASGGCRCATARASSWAGPDRGGRPRAADLAQTGLRLLV